MQGWIHTGVSESASDTLWHDYIICIISLYEVQDALLTTREFCCVEDEEKKNKLMPDYIVLILIHLKSGRYKTYIENASAGNCRNNYSKKKKS